MSGDSSGWDRYVRHVEFLDGPGPSPVHVTTRGVYLDGERIVLAPSPRGLKGESCWEITGGSFSDTRVTFWVRARDLKVDMDAKTVHVCGHEALIPPIETGLMVLHPELLHPDAPVSVTLQVERVTIRAADAPATRKTASGAR